MSDRRGRAGLGPKAPDEAGILGVFVAEQLDRHQPTQHLIDRLPDLAHPAGRQPPAHPVAASWQWVAARTMAANYPPDGEFKGVRP
jgi:hypothetical protein